MRYTVNMVCPQCGEKIIVLIHYIDCSDFSNYIFLRDRPVIKQNCQHNVIDYVLSECNQLYPQQRKEPKN